MKAYTNWSSDFDLLTARWVLFRYKNEGLAPAIASPIIFRHIRIFRMMIDCPSLIIIAVILARPFRNDDCVDLHIINNGRFALRLNNEHSIYHNNHHSKQTDISTHRPDTHSSRLFLFALTAHRTIILIIFNNGSNDDDVQWESDKGTRSICKYCYCVDVIFINESPHFNFDTSCLSKRSLFLFIFIPFNFSGPRFPLFVLVLISSNR